MLAEQLPAELFPFFLVFIRLGAAMMMMPAIGENGVSTRARLLLAIGLTAVVTPLIADTLPAQPAGPIDLGLLVIGEVVIGLFFGATTRMVMAALHVAGMIFAFQSSLAAAMMFDPNQSAQSSLFGNFLNLLAVVFIFATDLHHMLLRGLVGTYGVFPAGNMLPDGGLGRPVRPGRVRRLPGRFPDRRAGAGDRVPALSRRRPAQPPDAPHDGVLRHHAGPGHAGFCRTAAVDGRRAHVVHDLHG
jgi:hypothetical protein